MSRHGSTSKDAFDVVQHAFCLLPDCMNEGSGTVFHKERAATYIAINVLVVVESQPSVERDKKDVLVIRQSPWFSFVNLEIGYGPQPEIEIGGYGHILAVLRYVRSWPRLNRSMSTTTSVRITIHENWNKTVPEKSGRNVVCFRVPCS